MLEIYSFKPLQYTLADTIIDINCENKLRFGFF